MNPSQTLSISTLALLGVLGCESTPSSSPIVPEASAAAGDSIRSVRILSDTTLVDRPLDGAGPSAVFLDDSTVSVRHRVSVTSGYASFGVSSSADTLLVSAFPSGTPVDWMASFEYQAQIRIGGTCRVVHLAVDPALVGTDTSIAPKH